MTKFKAVLMGLLFFIFYGITSSVFGQFGGGDGSEATPYQLTSAVHLKTLADNVANGQDYTGQHFILTQDVSLQDYQTGEGWASIGNSEKEFNGIFNGKGHVITDLVINRPEAIVQGFFGLIGKDGKIDSLGIENGSVIGNENTGGFAGVNYGVITHCFYTGSVTGTGKYIGGLVGNNGNDLATSFENSVIIGCYSTATVTGAAEGVGGIAGVSINGYVWKCWNSGNIGGNTDLHGGIVGYNISGKIEDCYNTGNISGDGNHAGGITGMNSTPYNGWVLNCYNTGTVQGLHNVGGIVGSSINGTIKNCVALGQSVNGDGCHRIAGIKDGVTGTFSENYALNTMLVNEETIQSNDASSLDGLDKNIGQLKSESTYRALSWDFDNVWFFPAGGFPLLKGVSAEPIEECPAPRNANAATPHSPNWYSVKLTWNPPASTGEEKTSATELFNNGPIVTHPGQGYEGADVSAMINGSGLLGFVGNKELTTSLSDDFTLENTVQIDSIHFYTIQTVVSDPIAQANVKEMYVRIYDGHPNEGGEIIWGDFTTNVKGNVVFSQIYRTPETDLTNNARPVMRATANINTLLEPGTYWIEITVTSYIPTTTPGPGARILFPPVTVIGETNTGNAMYKDGSGWHPCVDPATSGNYGLPFVMYGAQESTAYNIYRDDVKINEEPITKPYFVDLVPQAGDYLYGISAVHADCESEKALAFVHLDQSPCEEAFPITSFYNEGFESGFPFCWTVETEDESKQWNMVTADVSEPATTKMGSYKAYFQAEEGVKAKLITKKLDISELENPELTFWYAQKAASENQDQLRIFYKNNPESEWVLLEAFTENTPDWDSVAIALPEPTATYWIAFEATGNNGHGVMLDEVSIKKTGCVHCDMPLNLNYTLHTPGYYSVNLNWDTPANATPAGILKILDNGPVVTHPGAGYNGADVSLIQEGAAPGGNGDQLSGYTLCDDFQLEKPTYIEHMTFYSYDLTAVGITPNVAFFFVEIYDKSPKEGGKVIWGDLYADRLNREKTAFGNVYRTYLDHLTTPSRPLTRIVANINHTLPAGTYWVNITASSKTPPYMSGTTWFPPVTILGEPNTGNALVREGLAGEWKEWIDPGTNGHCGLPFEIFGKELPVMYQVFRDGTAVSDGIAEHQYADVTPGSGTYEYGVVAVWENGCTSDTVKTTVVMNADPCETAISEFPYGEDFESEKSLPMCWSQEFINQQKSWEVVDADIAQPNTAHSGALKAYFTGSNDVTTKLIMPMFDLSNLENPTLKFWHAQREWYEDQNELRVYYKNAVDAEWTILAEYTEEIADWTESILLLPEVSATYWIAFEGVGNLGYAVLLDDITVYSGESQTFVITATVDGDGGTINPSGAVSVNQGENKTFNMVPNEGYKVADVLVDGVSMGALNEYTFENIEKNHSITAKFEEETAIDELSNLIKVYPNPTAGKLRITNYQFEIRNVSVFDITGRLVLEINNINNNEANIDLSSYAEGIYFLRVDGQTIKVVKQ